MGAAGGVSPSAHVAVAAPVVEVRPPAVAVGGGVGGGVGLGGGLHLVQTATLYSVHLLGATSCAEFFKRTLLLCSTHNSSCREAAWDGRGARAIAAAPSAHVAVVAPVVALQTPSAHPPWEPT